jgi:uncharacterized protein YbjT (DUF2867 family)
MLLVAGSTGFLGREICRRVAAEGHDVRGLTRATSDSDVVALLREWQVEPVVGDLGDRASLQAACRGVDTVISTASATRSRQPGEGIESTDLEGQLNLVEAARDAGVSHFIYVSFSGGIGADDPLTTAKRTVERRLRESGMAHTILRPSYFMEAWLSPALGFDYPAACATIYGSGEHGVSWIALPDVAAFALRCLGSAPARNATIELGGPEALSLRDVVRIFEEEGGRPFEIREVPEAALQAQAASADPMERTFAALMLGCARGDAIPMEATLRDYPLRLRTVREYARDVLGVSVSA